MTETVIMVLTFSPCYNLATVQLYNIHVSDTFRDACNEMVTNYALVKQSNALDDLGFDFLHIYSTVYSR